MNDVTLRPAHPADVGPLTTIFNHYVRTSHCTFQTEPATAEERARVWFPEGGAADAHRVLVASVGDEILGYAQSGRFRPRPAYDRTVETTVYCRPETVGRGLGSRLLEQLLATLAGTPAHQAVAFIALPNEASEALHLRLGYVLRGVLPEVGHKLGRAWDVAIYQRSLGSGG